MNYQRTKPASKRATKIALGVVVILILLRLIVPHAFSAFFTAVFSPLWRLEHFALSSVVSDRQIVFSSDSAFASSTIAALLQENSDLKTMLGRPTAQNSIITSVLSKPPFESYDTIIVDAGANQGVEAGDSVFALAYPVVYSTAHDIPPGASTTATSTISISSSVSSGTSSVSEKASSLSSSTVAVSSFESPQIEIPIGKVATIYANTSVVTLFSSPGQTYPVQIGAYHIGATATADGGGMFEAMVPNNSNIFVGDPV